MLRRRARARPGASRHASALMQRRIARSAASDAALHRCLTLSRQALGDAWSSWGYDVAQEPFVCAPHAFLGAIPVAVVLWMRALRFYDAKPLSALAACALGVAVFVAEIVMYREALETLRIFPVAQGEPARSTACSSVFLVRVRGWR